MKKSIYTHLLEKKESNQKMIALLIDPDKADHKNLDRTFQNVDGIDLIFVGGSLLTDGDILDTISIIKQKSDLPIIIFPGTNTQIAPNADGILFLSLLSSRNPEMLIGHQVATAPHIRKTKLEVISTAYLLIESGKQTTASYISNSAPIPSDKAEIAASTALAGQYMGMNLIYLDAGSGALNPVPPEMIQKVSEYTSVPIIVGGGINSKSKIKNAFDAGADIIVIGNAIESNPDFLKDINN